MESNDLSPLCPLAGEGWGEGFERPIYWVANDFMLKSYAFAYNEAMVFKVPPKKPSRLTCLDILAGKVEMLVQESTHTQLEKIQGHLINLKESQTALKEELDKLIYALETETKQWDAHIKKLDFLYHHPPAKKAPFLTREQYKQNVACVKNLILFSQARYNELFKKWGSKNQEAKTLDKELKALEKKEDLLLDRYINENLHLELLDLKLPPAAITTPQSSQNYTSLNEFRLFKNSSYQDKTDLEMNANNTI